MKRTASMSRSIKMALIVLVVLAVLVGILLVVRSILVANQPPKPYDYANMSSETVILSTQFMFMDTIQQKRMGFDQTAKQNRSPEEENKILKGYIDTYKKAYLSDEIKQNAAVRNGALKQPYRQLTRVSDGYIAYVERFTRDYEMTYKMKAECRQVFTRSEPFLTSLEGDLAKQFTLEMFKKDTAPCRDAADSLPSDALYKEEAKRVIAILDHVTPAVETYSKSTKDEAAIAALLKAGKTTRDMHLLDESARNVAQRGDKTSSEVKTAIDQFRAVADQYAK